MDLRKQSLTGSADEDENDRIKSGIETGATQTTDVLCPTELSRSDTTDASAIPSLSTQSNMEAIPCQMPPGYPLRYEKPQMEAIESRMAEPKTDIDDDSDRYNMQHKRRGVALIFNHEHFEQSGLKNRDGAAKDGKALEETLKKLSFDVRHYKDLTLAALKKTLRDVSMEDHQDADCLFVAIMTHGDKGGWLYAKDNPLTFEDIWQPFTADRVITLAGKPKIFLVQACRGQSTDDPVWVSDATDSALPNEVHSIPTRADFLFAHSTLEGHYSWRNPDSGSWFVQDFCDVMNKNGRQKDLLTIMTLTLKQVAFNRMSCSPYRQNLHQKKQMPVFSSTLTKLVYFDSTAV